MILNQFKSILVLNSWKMYLKVLILYFFIGGYLTVNSTVINKEEPLVNKRQHFNNAAITSNKEGLSSNTQNSSTIKENISLHKENTIPKVTKNETNKNGLIDRGYCNHENEKDSPYTYPWLVALIAFGWTVCSGSLINARYVLTTAQCASAPIVGTGVTFSIMAGDFNASLDCSNETSNYKSECVHLDMYGIEEAIPHPLYNNENNSSFVSSNNVGLIRLNKTIVYRDYLQPVCLPSSETVPPKFGDTFYYSGWAVVWDEELGRERIKKRISATLVTEEECKEKFKKCNMTSYALYDYNRCMVETTKLIEFSDFADFGDSGGSIMSFTNNKWQMEGIFLNFKSRCIEEPLLYIRVSHYLDWIEANMRPWN